MAKLEESTVQELLTLYNQGQLVGLEKKINELLLNNSDNFFLYNLLGASLVGQKKFKEAINSYKKSISLNPNYPETHTNLGVVLSKLGNHNDAINSYNKAISLKSDYVEAYINLGVVLRKKGDLEEAAEQYDKALNINSNSADAYYNLGNVLKEQGKLADACIKYQKAISINPKYFESYNNLGLTLKDLGSLDKAIQNYENALKINPNYTEANYNMADVFYQHHKWEKAILYYEKSKIKDWEARSLYCYYKSEKYEEFKLKLEHLINKKNVSPLISALSTHYAANFKTINNYNFCKNPLDYIYHNNLEIVLQKHPSLKTNLLKDIESAEIDKREQDRLYKGVQSSGNLFKRNEDSFKKLSIIIKNEINLYFNKFKEKSSEFIKEFPSEIDFENSWYINMEKGGHLGSHIHENGWLSGSFYLTVPTNKNNNNEGDIELSINGDSYPTKHSNFPKKIISIKNSDIIMFPSSLFHRTIPFTSDEKRICIAFDLKSNFSFA